MATLTKPGIIDGKIDAMRSIDAFHSDHTLRVRIQPKSPPDHRRTIIIISDITTTNPLYANVLLARCVVGQAGCLET